MLSVRYRRERFSTNGSKRRARLVLEKWAAFIAILFEEVNWGFFAVFIGGQRQV